MKNWDVIVVGGGIIGLSLAIELRKHNASVLVVERGEPGREASYAAAGMLADAEIEESSLLKPLATASARMYPEFVHELQDESGVNCDLRDQGTLQISEDHTQRVELQERSVDPRALLAAVLKAARHRGVDISSGSEVLEVSQSEGKVAGVRTVQTTYGAPAVVNCGGAWAGKVGPSYLPTRPVKGQMLCVIDGAPLRHVIRSRDVYIVPRTNGRILIGSTVEDAGFDKRVDAETIRRLHQTAIDLVPGLKQARILEDWAGLRPGTPDDLPILGGTAIPGYFVATGHFRDGILLAPITAQVMAQVITGKKPDYDLTAFSAGRFQNSSAAVAPEAKGLSGL